MFRKTKNIDTAFRQMKVVTLVAILVSLLIACFVAYKSFEYAKTMQGKIYVLANGKAIEAFASERKDNIEVQAKDHIKTFHRYFFSLTPDETYIQRTINSAMYLADHTAKQQYDNLRESNYYTNIVSGNVSQSVLIDSVWLDLESIPFRFRFFGRQEITRPTSMVIRSLITEGALREVRQSEHNPHGFLIERWRIVENRDLSIKNR